MLSVRDLNAYYGRAHVLADVSLEVGKGEVAVLLGRNGAGKSTALKSIAGWLRSRGGEIVFDGRRIDSLPVWRVARAGLGYVPEDRRIFTDLTVMENLDVGRQRGGWSPERVFALFPNLAEARNRPASRISGGEQQMLAIGRCLMGNPSCILLAHRRRPGRGRDARAQGFRRCGAPRRAELALCLDGRRSRVCHREGKDQLLRSDARARCRRGRALTLSVPLGRTVRCPPDFGANSWSSSDTRGLLSISSLAYMACHLLSLYDCDSGQGGTRPRFTPRRGAVFAVWSLVSALGSLGKDALA
jgi:ABC-type sugar transport system ATPase subunit